jgi:Ca2+-binding RTX toxin-like protein
MNQPQGRPISENYDGNEISFNISANLGPDDLQDPIPNAPPGQTYPVNYLEFILEEPALEFTKATVEKISDAQLRVTLSVRPLVTPNANRQTITIDASEVTHNGHGIQFGLGSIATTVYANSSNRPVIQGGNGQDFLYGSDQNETLNGQGNADYMNGKGGNDTYVVDNANDFIEDLPETGVETVSSSVDWSLSFRTQNPTVEAANKRLVTGLDNLKLTGAAIKGEGNYLNNEITGNNKNNVLVGFADLPRLPDGSIDDLTAGISDPALSQRIQNQFEHQVDRLWGGKGRDTFGLGDTNTVFYQLSRDDDYARIKDFGMADRIRIKGAATDYRFTVRNGNTRIYSAGNNDLVAIVEGITNTDFITDRLISV